MGDSTATLRWGAAAVAAEAAPMEKRLFWQRLSGSAAAPIIAGTAHGGMRLKRHRPDPAIDVAPADHSHPQYWAAFAIHGLPDGIES